MNPHARNVILLVCTMLTSACSTLKPVAVLCPPPPPAPQILTLPASAEPRLIEDWQALMQRYRQALSQSFGEAIKP